MTLQDKIRLNPSFPVTVTTSEDFAWGVFRFRILGGLEAFKLGIAFPVTLALSNLMTSSAPLLAPCNHFVVA
jgi:hypothetical protein